LPENNSYLSEERIELLRKIDAIVMRKIKKAGLYNKIWQFPVILIPICDKNGRESIVLRPFVSRDVMTLEFAKLKKTIIKEIVRDIMSTEKISYIFYDLTNKPPGTVEWE
jgi:GMP synthase (glutamine-hydrolysing)